MALNSSSTVDPNSGFCSRTKTFHSLRPVIPLPPLTTPLSFPHYLFSLLHHSPTTTSSSLIDAATRRLIPLSHLPHLVRTLASNLRQYHHLSKNDVALILSPNTTQIPILYLSLLSLGVTVAPSNPLSSTSDISHQIHVSNPSIAFVTAEYAAKIPQKLQKGIIIVVIDSSEFKTLMYDSNCIRADLDPIEVFQNDAAAILYSSGTTGRVKGVELTHLNLIAAVAGAQAGRLVRASPAVTLCAVPFFHVYGFVLCMRELAFGGGLVVASRGSLESMMGVVEEFKVTHLAVAPPTLVAMVKNSAVERYDLGSLEAVMCGGASLANSVIERFNQKFAKVSVLQAYGLTETTGGITRMVGLSESRVTGANGRLISNCEAKIVDPVTGDSLPPLKSGEIWIRGPMVMKGYVGDKLATAAMVDSEGWLRTGDICYFDNEGFLFYVDRIKELIKYKGYQVAPAELEDLLLSHPAIVDAAVIPYPDEDAGQVPAAFVVRQSGSTVNDSQIMDFVVEKVAPYKKIRRVFFIDSIPKNAPGKVLRKELIKLASSIASKL